MKINKDDQSYQRAQDAMINFGAADTILDKYQNLSHEHLVLPADLTEKIGLVKDLTLYRGCGELGGEHVTRV